MAAAPEFRQQLLDLFAEDQRVRAELAADGTSETFRAGDTTAEPGTTVHWHRNDGKDPVIMIAVDVFNTKPAK